MVYEIRRQVLPTAPSPTTTHFIVCIFSWYHLQQQISKLSTRQIILVYSVSMLSQCFNSILLSLVTALAASSRIFNLKHKQFEIPKGKQNKLF